jgi:hypothetical protein
MTSPSVQMRLDMLPGGQYLTVYSSAMLSHLGDRARFKVLPIDLGDIAGPMAALTLKVRPPQGAVKLVLVETHAIAKTISS